MAKLGDMETHAAWEDFKGFLISTEMLKDLGGLTGELLMREKMKHQFAQTVFKHGYVTGARAVQLNVLLTATATKKEEKKPKITRTHKGRIRRTDEDRRQEGEDVEKILEANIFALPLVEIIKRMQRLGHKHWCNKNASGFMQTAEQDGFLVEKAGHGLYRFKGDAE